MGSTLWESCPPTHLHHIQPWSWGTLKSGCRAKATKTKKMENAVSTQAFCLFSWKKFWSTPRHPIAEGIRPPGNGGAYPGHRTKKNWGKPTKVFLNLPDSPSPGDNQFAGGSADWRYFFAIFLKASIPPSAPWEPIIRQTSQRLFTPSQHLPTLGSVEMELESAQLTLQSPQSAITSQLEF